MGFFHNSEGHGVEGPAKSADSDKLQSLRTLRVETLWQLQAHNSSPLRIAGEPWPIRQLGDVENADSVPDWVERKNHETPQIA